jgi:hypothetical protein
MRKLTYLIGIGLLLAGVALSKHSGSEIKIQIYPMPGSGYVRQITWTQLVESLRGLSCLGERGSSFSEDCWLYVPEGNGTVYDVCTNERATSAHINNKYIQELQRRGVLPPGTIFVHYHPGCDFAPPSCGDMSVAKSLEEKYNIENFVVSGCGVFKYWMKGNECVPLCILYENILIEAYQNGKLNTSDGWMGFAREYGGSPDQLTLKNNKCVITVEFSPFFYQSH